MNKKVYRNYHHDKVYTIAILLLMLNRNYYHNNIRYRIGLLYHKGILFCYYVRVHLFNGLIETEWVWWTKKVEISRRVIIDVGDFIMLLFC